MKKLVLQEIIDLFFEFDSIKTEDLTKLKLSTRKRIIAKLNKSIDKIAIFKYFLSLTLPEDKRFIRLKVEDFKDEYLAKPFLVSEWAYPNFPFLLANKRFLTAAVWLSQIVEEEGYKLKLVRGFIPFVRMQAFTWALRPIVTHGKGKGMDIIIENKTPAESLNILKRIWESLESPPFSLAFIEMSDSVHVNFVPFATKRRFFPANSYRFKSCSDFNPNLWFLSE
ncbi:hypothetical protein [Caldisericum sp.]|uniref:hypothetical protein n=1 Tax=Caldisericum sp. TaxID=2499687 RepID=UPI003D11A8C9